MGRWTTKVALLAAAVLLTAAVHGRVPDEARIARDDVFVPRPEVARATALGFEAVLADYYWLQAVQVVGDEQIAERKGYLLGPLIDVVTTLDPWVDHPYRFAAVWLTHDLDAVRKANELLRRGIEYHPTDWRNRFFLGFNLFWYLDRDSEAATVIEQALDLPGAPAYLRRLVARLKGQGDGLDVAESFLHGLILEAADDSEREQYLSALDEIATERVARTLDAARAQYKERNGRDIQGVQDLTRGAEPVLGELPAEPHGGGWTIDPESGLIVSDVLRHRYAAKVDAVNRKRVESLSKKGAEVDGG